MTERTSGFYIPAPYLKAGMLVRARPNEPLREVEDVVLASSEGALRVTLSDEVSHRTIIETYQPTDRIEIHFTLDQALAEYRRLAEAEGEAMQKAYRLADRCSVMASVARDLGWRG